MREHIVLNRNQHFYEKQLKSDKRIQKTEEYSSLRKRNYNKDLVYLLSYTFEVNVNESNQFIRM